MKDLNELTLVEQLYEIKNALKNEMRALGYAKNTIDLYMREIEHFINFCTKYDGEITYDEIIRPIILEALEYREKISPKEKISANTKDIFIKAIERLFSFIQDNIDPEKDYLKMFSKIKIRKEIKEKPYLNDDEIKRFLDAVEQNKKKLTYNRMRDALLAKILLYGGLRINEALNLKFSDFSDANDGSIYRIRVLGKGNKEAYVYIKKTLIEDELTELKDMKIDEEMIFLTKKGRQMSAREARSAIEKFYRRAGISKRGLHILRHTLAMKLVREGVDILHIQKILRHSNITTTTIYARSSEEDMVKIAKRF